MSRIEPQQNPPADVCIHFGECGGCASQDLPYPHQLKSKAAALQDLFAAYWDAPIPIEPSPEAWYYRNKVDLTFGQKYYDEAPPKGTERESVLGYKRQGRWYWPLEVSECLLFAPDLPPLLESVRGWMRTNGHKAYNSRRDEGLLRILLLRQGKRTGQRMVVLITRHEEFDRQGFVDAVRAAWPEVASIQWALFTGRADVAAGERVEVLYGAPAIEEHLHIQDRVLRFTLSPFSFFQTNTLGTERLYGLIRSWVDAHRPETLYDLYGGSGGIAFSCADLVQRVISVESFEAASLDGIHNAARNGVANVEFITQEVEKYLRDRLQSDGLAPGAVIVDPPRAGLHPKALRRLLELAPERVLYVSCKPSVLAAELPQWLENYRLASLQAVDLFPHTPHAEVLASMERLPHCPPPHKPVH